MKSHMIWEHLKIYLWSLKATFRKHQPKKEPGPFEKNIFVVALLETKSLSLSGVRSVRYYLAFRIGGAILQELRDSARSEAVLQLIAQQLI